MTTLRAIVTKALRENGLIQLGTNPDNDEYSEAVGKLKTLIPSLLGAEGGESFQTLTFGLSGVTRTINASDYTSWIRSNYIPSNHRILFNHDQAETLYLVSNPQDGARFSVVGDFNVDTLTINANGRSIENSSSITLNTADVSREWMYRADLGGWSRITDLDDDDELPYPSEFEDLFITLLALRVSPQYGVDIAQGTMSFYNRTLKKFKSRYTQKRETSAELGLLNLSGSNLQGEASDFTTGRY